MQTGNFENFAGNLLEVGPLYPFVGTEMLMFVAAVIFWLWWHVSELRIERREYEQEIEKFSDADAAAARLDKEAE